MLRDRIAYDTFVPEPVRKLYGLSMSVHKAGIGSKLLDLVFMRISQLNGCAHCLDLHARVLLEAGEDPRRLAALAGWRGTQWFDARERAALDWTERVTAIQDAGALDPSAAELAKHMDEKEIAELTFVIAEANAWNRLAIALRARSPEVVTTQASPTS